jgi:hypothetical protein
VTVLGALVVLAIMVVLPVLAADPSGGTGSPSASASPSAAPATLAPAGSRSPTATTEPKPDASAKAGRGAKPEKAPAADVTITGTVAVRTDGSGQPEYTVTTGGVVRVLSAGPSWYWGDKNPLAAYVGTRVTVAGKQGAGNDEVEVRTVNGTAIRAAGRPPWAGGWKVVGEGHPGWSEEKADRMQAKRDAQARAHGTDCWPPGLCKHRPTDGDASGPD